MEAAEGTDYNESPGIAAGLQALSPQLRVALCSPDVSRLLGHLRPAEFSSRGPAQDLVRQEDARANRIILQPVAIIQGTHYEAANVVQRLRRLRFSAEYFGLKATPVELNVEVLAEGEGGGSRSLLGAGASAAALEFCLASFNDAITQPTGRNAASKVSSEALLRLLRTRPLQVDVWDGESGFALGCVEVSGLVRLVRQGREAVYFYDICPFLPPLAPPAEYEIPGSIELGTRSSSFVATKEVQVPGLEKGASLAFRVVCVAHDNPQAADAERVEWNGGVLLSSLAQVHSAGGVAPTRVPLKARNIHYENVDGPSEGDGGIPGALRTKGGGRDLVDSLLNLTEGGGAYVGWHRVRPDQSALPQVKPARVCFCMPVPV